MYSFLPPLHTSSAVPTWQDSCLTASCLFLLCKSLESCSLAQGTTHRDIQGSPMIKPASSPAVSVPHSFSFCSHSPVSPCDFHLLQQLWSQWGCLTLQSSGRADLFSLHGRWQQKQGHLQEALFGGSLKLTFVLAWFCWLWGVRPDWHETETRVRRQQILFFVLCPAWWLVASS